jgi:hypothetical protein
MAHKAKNLFNLFVKGKKMTQAQTKDQGTMQNQTPQQQHHQQAAEHHEQASKHHKEASKYCETNDNKSAAHHDQTDQGHAVQATGQAGEASKKYSKTNS